jgi:cyclase
MLTARIIPCLDVKGGRVVKGVRFQGLRDAGDPAERAAAYEAQGADELVLLDVSATTEERSHALETVRAVRHVLSIPLTVGGGVRTVADAEALLSAGADKVSVNTAAVERPALVAELSARFGAQCTVVAIDAAGRDGGGGWEVVVRSGKERTGRDAIAWAREVMDLGAGELLLTSWDRDGTRSGYDCALLEAVHDAVTIPVIASGGAAHAAHLAEALKAGADAVLAASIFHDGDLTVADVKAALAREGLGVRL